ncbi:MAG: (Fe-S)-binding protein [Anaerolineales bacterium]|jgi:ArsR family metal-binding transcriptional regulator
MEEDTGSPQLIEAYEMEVFTPPCDPGTRRFSAKAHLKADIREVLPFLNAILTGAEYNPAATSLRWRSADHMIVFHPLEIAISNLVDRDEAEREIHSLIELVNTTWERRSEIVPSEDVRRRPSHLSVFKLLPGTNCKACGEMTCYNFALKLSIGQANLADCLELTKLEHRAARSQLEDLLMPISSTQASGGYLDNS